MHMHETNHAQKRDSKSTNPTTLLVLTIAPAIFTTIAGAVPVHLLSVAFRSLSGKGKAPRVIARGSGHAFGAPSVGGLSAGEHWDI
eukprot:2965641-Amphidinium_carterae.1